MTNNKPVCPFCQTPLKYVQYDSHMLSHDFTDEGLIIESVAGQVNKAIGFLYCPHCDIPFDYSYKIGGQIILFTSTSIPEPNAPSSTPVYRITPEEYAEFVKEVIKTFEPDIFNSYFFNPTKN